MPERYLQYAMLLLIRFFAIDADAMRYVPAP